MVNPQIGLSSKTRRTQETNTEIVVVSDTVRQRRARAPSSSNENSDKMIVDTTTTTTTVEASTTENRCNVLPDLLPATFRLAESSSLFSQISVESEPIQVGANDIPSDGDDDVSVVEVRESNLTPKMQIRIANQDEMENVAKIEDVTNTISIIETVETFEPEFVETVNIIYASDASSCSTPVLDDRDDFIERGNNKSIESSFDDLEEEERLENDVLRKSSNGMIFIAKQRLSYDDDAEPSSLLLSKERDLLKDSENDKKVDTKKPRRNIAPKLKEILSYPERDSFYFSDKEIDDPLVFSEDEDIPRFSLEMNQDLDSDSDTVFSLFFNQFSIFPPDNIINSIISERCRYTLFPQIHKIENFV